MAAGWNKERNRSACKNQPRAPRPRRRSQTRQFAPPSCARPWRRPDGSGGCEAADAQYRDHRRPPGVSARNRAARPTPWTRCMRAPGPR